MRTLSRCLLAVALVALAACRREKGSRLSRTESDQLRPAAEWLLQEPVAILRDYVRLETTAEKGEAAGVELLQRLLDCDGIETEVVCPAPTRCNLLARIPGQRRQGALLLLNHVDVVRVVPALWTEAPPFEGRIINGFLYGRGTYDMKSIGIAQALALREIRRRGIIPRSDLLFLAEADEETGQRWGSHWLLEHRPEWFRGVSEVLNEGGTNEMILRQVRFWGIETVQAGYGVIELDGSDAAVLSGFAAERKTLTAPPTDPLPVVVEGFDMLANHLGPPLTDPLRHLDRLRANRRELSTLPDRYGAFLEPRIYWSPSYASPDEPGRFRAFAVVSTPPGTAPDPFLRAIDAGARRAGLRVRDTFSSGATRESPYPTGFTELLKRVTEAAFPGIPFGPVPTYGGITTSVYFRDRGFSAYGYSPIPMNITDSSRRHGNNERIFLRDYLEGVRLYSEIVAAHAAGSENNLSPPSRGR